jgi:hypothetical protein
MVLLMIDSAHVIIPIPDREPDDNPIRIRDRFRVPTIPVQVHAV